jgi:hypothetical protein
VLIGPATTMLWGENPLGNLYYINLLKTPIIGMSHLESKAPAALYLD